MKKSLSALCFILLFCVLLPTAGYTEGQDSDTLTDWNLKITVPDGATAVLNGSEYYIYAQQAGSIPYVMVRTYSYDDAETFLSIFTEYMQEQYSDLKITADTAEKIIGDKKCFEIDYTYKVSGYDVRDRRIVIAVGGKMYMFSSKEIEELGMTLGDMLEDVVANCEFLSESETSQGSGLADGYLYCQENGMPKYWLDLTEIGEDILILHCWFRSGDPVFYEKSFVLDLTSAEVSENGLKIRQVHDMQDFDYSDRFRDLTLQFYLDGAVMIVERDEKTLAGGSEDNILTGSYAMRPVGVSADSPENERHLRPAADGPYQPEEIAIWAQFYYFRNTGFFPPEAETIINPDGTFTVHLYETVDLDGEKHTATSAWYTVDVFGEGKNDLTEENVFLMQ